VLNGRSKVLVRDDFSAKTIRLLAARVGHHCANPGCVRSTSGPAVDPDRTVNVGVAAHITAASPGGKRYDENMTSAERRSASNGIWLCQTCGKLIDSDEDRYTAPLLHQWKLAAEQAAIEAIASGRALGPVKPSAEPDAADQEFLHGLDLPSADAVDAVTARLRTAAEADIAAFRVQRENPARTVALRLRLGATAGKEVSLESLGRMTTLAEPVWLVAPGGTGKSTTLLQLAESLAGAEGAVPFLVPLGEWSDREDDFFDFTLRRNNFGRFRRQHLMQLAYHGRLVLLLDGWNELTPEARLRATNDLGALRRDYPQLGLVISTRRETLSLAGPVVTVEALSEEQQLELARAARGEEGVELVDRAWRTPGVRELVGIPLYLNALLVLPAGAPFPETKEAVLRMFVQQNERAPARIERLERDTLGQHRTLLVDLAAAANRAGNTALLEANVSRVVTGTMRRLSEDGLIGVPPQPRTVIAGLVGAHLLVRGAGDEGTIAFQHQVFQEWYAAAEVEALMVQSAGGDPAAHRRLREEILNRQSWEESVLFACERLSRDDAAGAGAVAAAIEDTLGIDPILAAEMIYRSAEATWLQVHDRVRGFVTRWHRAGGVDRAVRFMIASGKPEFADLVWPLISNANDQIQLGAFRTADHFRVGVLGPDGEGRLRGLATRQREIALSEIAHESGYDGMELAARLAANDPEPEVVVKVVEALAFRRGDRHVIRILQAAPGAVWQAVAKAGFPERLTDPALNERLVLERAEVWAAETDSMRLLHQLVEERPADVEVRITGLIATAEIDPRNNHLDHAIAHAHEAFPGAVAAGLMTRLVENRPLPYGARRFLKDAALVDEGPIAAAALDPTTGRQRLQAAAAVIGPMTVGQLLEELFVIDARIEAAGRANEELRTARWRLSDAIALTRQDAFIEVLLAQGRTENPHRIAVLADLLARNGREGGGEQPGIMVRREAVREMLAGWMATIVAAPAPHRYASSEVARAAERLADAALAEPLRQLLERDLVEEAQQREAFRRAAARGALDMTNYRTSYGRAFAAMHDAPAVAVLTAALEDVRWGLEAASALYDIWRTDHGPKEQRFFGGGYDFSEYRARRAAHAAGVLPTSVFAEAIFGVVRDMGEAARSEGEQQHALGLAVTGLALPHGNKHGEIERLLALPRPIIEKRRLLAASASAGEVVPVGLLMEGLRDLLEAALTERWRLDENRGELMGWLELFPFSDDPARLHEALAMLPAEHRRPHALRRLLNALPHGEPNSALAVLQRLAADDPAFLREYDWMNALMRLGTEAAAFALLDHLGAETLQVGDGFQLSRVLAAWAEKYPRVRAAMIERHRALPRGGSRQVLEMAMCDTANEEVFWALFEAHAGQAEGIHAVSRVLRNLSVGKRPSASWAGAYEEFGMPLTALRSRLFGMLPAGDARARLAKECLIAIDEYRDKRGRAGDEPRHPDIASGRSWPPEAEAPDAAVGA
jgi:hypothetical protein